MSQDQSNSLISVTVRGEPGLFFLYNAKTGTVSTETGQEPICTINVSRDAYDRLAAGQSTFEDEAVKGNVRIGKNYQLLVEMGKALRVQ